MALRPRSYWWILPLAWLAGPLLAAGQLFALTEQCGGGCLDAAWCEPAFWTTCVAPGGVATWFWLRALRRSRHPSSVVG